MSFKHLDYKILMYLAENVRIIPRMYCTAYKIIPQLDEKIHDQIINNQLNERNYPGVIKSNCVKLPEKIKNAIEKVIADTPKKQLVNDSILFARYLHERKLPVENTTLKQKVNVIKKEVESCVSIDKEILDEDAQEYLKKMIEFNTEKILKQRIYNWQPVNYSRHKGLQYLIARAPPEYAVLIQIFKEIKIRGNFTPTTLFDFGSGVGTVAWAANEIWGSKIQEIFCVDSSREMNSLAEDLNNISGLNSILKNKIMYRQFLPTSHPQYDIVVSAYSLLELASAKARLETVSALWNKSTKYLILIEQGTTAGFKVISEARKFILQAIAETNQSGHIFSPCPHDFQCPRLTKDISLCNFEASHYTYSPSKCAKKEFYSYVIISKEARQEEDQQWPRIVQPVLKRSRHVICRMCTSSGDIQEITFTPSKHERTIYRCARNSNWGDRLPFTLEKKSVECNLKKKKNSSN